MFDDELALASLANCFWSRVCFPCERVIHRDAARSLEAFRWRCSCLFYLFHNRGHPPLLSSIEYKRYLREAIAYRSARKANLLLLESVP